jgi:hypothetical protein
MSTVPFLEDLLGTPTLSRFLMNYFTGSFLGTLVDEAIVPFLALKSQTYSDFTMNLETGLHDDNQNPILFKVPLNRLLIKLILWCLCIYLVFVVTNSSEKK